MYIVVLSSIEMISYVYCIDFISTSNQILVIYEFTLSQLKEIEGALSSAEEAEKQQLQELQANLLQLLDLTLQQLNQQSQLKGEEEPQQHTSGSRNSDDSSQSASDKSSSSCSDKNLDDEFALFQVIM